MAKYPKYIKTVDGQIGTYAHLTFGNRPVYRFETGEFKFRQATDKELENGSDNLSDFNVLECSQMQWKQLSSTVWEAIGKFGKFRIERSRGKYWAKYASEDITINYRPKCMLSETKDFCERSPYWEDAA